MARATSAEPPVEEAKITIYARRLEALADRHDGELTAEIVVADAKKASSPLHDWFEWSDTEAARQYRLVQARSLIQRVTVIVRDEVEPERTVRVRRFAHVGGSYRRTEEALASEPWRTELLQRMARDVALLRERYRVYSNMAGEIAAVDEHLAAAEVAAKKAVA